MAEPRLDHNLNRLHQGTGRCVIGTMPVSYEESDAPPSVAINANITSFVSPGLKLSYKLDGNFKALVHIPITEDNAYYDQRLTINMIADDRLENYWTLYRYMKTIQSGFTDAYPIEDTNHRIYANDRKYRNRLTYIPRIDIIFGDDSHQKHQTMRFQRCYPDSISELNMNFGPPEPVTFIASFLYTLVDVIREEPPSDEIIPPKGVAGAGI